MTGFAYNELACFLAVAEHGHFGRAAAALQLTQPAVSKIVRRVEQGVGAALFTRGTHGVALTSSGQLFMEPARQLVLRHEETMRAASDIQAQHVGLIRLGFTQATSESRATRAVAELLRRRPGLRVRLTVGKSDDLERALLDGSLDLAVVPSYPGHATRCAQVVIGEDELWAAARPRHPLFQLALEQGLRFGHLQGYSWALPAPGAAVRKVVSGGVFLSAQLAERVVQQLNGQSPVPDLQMLTNRELDILQRIVSGQRPVDIADALHLSIKTVSTHKKRIQEKLKLDSTAALIRFGLEHRLGNELIDPSVDDN